MGESFSASPYLQRGLHLDGPISSQLAAAQRGGVAGGGRALPDGADDVIPCHLLATGGGEGGGAGGVLDPAPVCRAAKCRVCGVWGGLLCCAPLPSKAAAVRMQQ